MSTTHTPETLEHFADWCEAKGDEKFAYADHENCACAQYAKEIGANYVVPEVDAEGDFWQRAEYFAACNLRFSDVAFEVRAALSRAEARP